MNKTKKSRLNTRMSVLLFFLTVSFFLGSGIALADVNPSSITGSPGDSITVSINIDNLRCKYALFSCGVRVQSSNFIAFL